MTLSVPSYVIPGTYAQNVRFLDAVPEVRGVELLFYLFDDGTRDLFARERPAIEPYRGRFSFSAHLPDPLLPEHEEVRRLTDGLVSHYIVHPPEGEEGAFIRIVDGWRRRYGEIFLLENLIGRDFPALARHRPALPVCLDTGHLLLSGGSIGRFLEEYGERIGEIHLHGVQDGHDHRGFGPGEAWFAELVPFLRAFRGTLELEVFSMGEVRAILEALRAHGLPA